MLPEEDHPFGHYLPEDVNREVISHLDTPSLLSTRELSHGWKWRKAWCTSKWIQKQKEDGVTGREATKILEETNRRMFILTVASEYTESIVTMYFIMPRVKQVLKVLKLYIGGMTTPANYDRPVHTERQTTNDPHHTLLHFQDVSDEDWELEYYWFDPFTTREVLKRRLVGCDVDIPTILDLFPSGGMQDDLATLVRRLYAVGTHFCMESGAPYYGDTEADYERAMTALSSEV